MIGNLKWLLLFAVACSKSPDACERLAPRLMPDPEKQFIELCQSRYANEPAFARMVECILAIDHPLYEKDIASCPDSEMLRGMYFHF